MDEQGPQEAHNQEAWESYIAAERRELALRREGHLARILGAALPNESTEELRRRAEEDRLRAEEGLVELMDEHGQITHKHIDDLAPEDRQARIRAEGARIKWIAERQTRRPPPPTLSSDPTDG
jgi:hypothetical protein